MDTSPTDLPPEKIRLDALERGQCAIIRDVEDETELDRLKSMGVCKGRYIELVKHGDPLIIKVFASRIGLSARLARRVWVEPCATVERCWLRIGPPLSPGLPSPASQPPA